jgi:Leucine-rich repeat (LRR) protein
MNQFMSSSFVHPDRVWKSQLDVNIDSFDIDNLNKIKILQIENDQFIHRFPENLIDLRIYNHRYLHTLPKLPETLKYMYMINCDNLHALKLPDKLIKLAITDCGITKLPTLPEKLQILSCSENNLTELSDLPNEIIFINCSKNNISKIDKLPNNLKIFDCSSNPLTTIPLNLPTTLETINYTDTYLTITCDYVLSKTKLINSILE